MACSVASAAASNNGSSAASCGTALTSETFVYIAVDPHNVGHVYKVVDTLAAAAVVTKMGEIDMSEVSWLGLDNTDFFGAAP